MRIAVGFCFLCLLLATTPRGGDATPLQEKFVIFPSEISAREGEKLTLTCLRARPVQEAADPPPSYEWVKDGKVILGQREKILILKELSVQDDGIYQCGPPDINILKVHFHLHVKRGSRASTRSRRALGRSSENLETETFYVDEYGSPLEGRPLRLRCYHFGPPSTDHTATFIWFKDGAVIEGKTEQDINFESLTRKDEGVYECQIQDSDVPRKPYHLPVPSTLPRPMAFMDRFPVCSQRFSLECLIMEGYKWHKNLVYTWYKGSTKIEGQSHQVMWFDNVTKADTGKYTCTVRDGHESSTSPHSLPFDLNPFVVPEVYIKPTTPDDVVNGILGGNLTLTCEVSYAYPSVPSRGYSWTFLPSSQGPPQPLPLRTKTLTLSHLTKEQSGEYFCQARNDQDLSVTMVGKASVTVDIVYLENMYLTPAEEVDKGDWVTFTCKVDSHPIARLTWLMDGRKIRQVVDNLDHLVIPGVTCADSMNYTCLASNSDMPGRDVKATTQLLVFCNDDDERETQLSTTEMGVSAQFNLSLPRQTAVVVVHPNGQDIITVYQNCSYNIFPEFASRCLDPFCDAPHRHFFFILSEITEKDEGNYVCKDTGPQRKRIPNCQHKLILSKPASDTKMCFIVSIFLGVFMIIAIIALIIKVLLGHQKTKDLQQKLGPGSVFSGEEKGKSFENLFCKGRVYVFPSLKLSNQDSIGKMNEDGEDTPLLSTEQQHDSDETYEFEVKDLLRHTLQKISGTEGLPSFLLHNIRLGSQTEVILILSRILGIVVLMVEATTNEGSRSIDAIIRCLEDAKQAVTETLKDLVKPGSITAVIASNVPSTDRGEHVEEQSAVQWLVGKNREDFLSLAERLRQRPYSDVWKSRNPDIAFKNAASKFLTLDGNGCAGESSGHGTVPASHLLTPEQMEVRDSTARLLHLYGPAGEGKAPLLIHKAEQWLAEGNAVVLAVGKDIYDKLLDGILRAMLTEQGKERSTMIRFCTTGSALEVALKDLRRCYPKAKICVGTTILRHSGVFQNILKMVAEDKIFAVRSAGTTDLHLVDLELSMKALHLGWESIHLPARIQPSRSTLQVLNMLKSKPFVDNSPTTSTAKSAGDKVYWKIVDHCLHQYQTPSTSTCVQCKEELSDALPSTDKNLSRDWVALHTDFTDVECLHITLQGLGVLISTDMFDNRESYSGSLQTTSRPGDMGSLVGEQELPAIRLLKPEDMNSSETKGMLLVHWDDRDNDHNCQSSEQRKRRLNSHREKWKLAASKCRCQVILLLLTPSPARSLLNLPDPVVA